MMNLNFFQLSNLKSWVKNSLGGVVKINDKGDVLSSSALVYYCRVEKKTWSFLSLVQKKKRANATTQFWYTDLSMIVLKRKHGSNSWNRFHCELMGVQRNCDVELFLDPEFEYCVIPFSFLSGKEELQCGSQAQIRKSALFRFSAYSAHMVDLKARPIKSIESRNILIESLHFSLLSVTDKLIHPLGPSSVLVAVYKDGCVYFLVLNASPDGFMMQLNVETNQGMTTVHGLNKDTHIIPSKSQSVVLVLANDGHHNTTSINFRYLTDSCVGKKISQPSFTYRGIGTRATLCLAGEFLCTSTFGSENKYRSGTGTLDCTFGVPPC